MSWASPIVEDPRWQERVGDDPVKIAEGRDRLWGEFLLHDPGAADLLEGLPEERVEGLRAEFDERLQESHPNAFTVKTATREREVEVPAERMASAPGFGPAGTMYQGTRTRTVKEDVRRPVYDVATETFISRFGEKPGSLDWEKFDQEDLEGATALLLEAYPDRKDEILGPARERAKSILKERGMVLFPEADAEKPGEETELAKVFLQEASRRGLALAEGAGAGPLTDLMGLALDAGRGARVSAVPGVPIVPEDREAGGQREEIDKVMRQYTALAKDNRRLADLAYGDDTALQRAAGTGLAWLGGANALFRGSLRGRLVAQRDEAGRKILTRGGDVATRRDLSFALDPLSKKGLAAGAGIDAAIGAAYGPEYAPSFIAQAAGLDPNRLTSAVESGAFGLAAGTLLRGLANQRMLSRVRKMPQFADLADLGDREFARAAVERMQEVWEAGRRRAAQQAGGSGTRAGPRETEAMGSEFVGDVAEAARRPAAELPAGRAAGTGAGEAPAAPAAEQPNVPEFARKAGIETWEQAQRSGVQGVIGEAAAIADEIVKPVERSIPGDPAAWRQTLAEQMVSETARTGSRKSAFENLARKYTSMATPESTQAEMYQGIAQGFRRFSAAKPAEAPAEQPNVPVGRTREMFQREGGFQLVPEEAADQAEATAAAFARREAEAKQMRIPERTDPGRIQEGDDFQVTVQEPQGNVPGYVQVDLIRAGENIESGSVESFRAAGVDVPDVPDWVPQGRYTVEELRKAIEQGPKKPAGKIKDGSLGPPKVSREPVPGRPRDGVPASRDVRVTADEVMADYQRRLVDSETTGFDRSAAQRFGDTFVKPAVKAIEKRGWMRADEIAAVGPFSRVDAPAREARNALERVKPMLQMAWDRKGEVYYSLAGTQPTKELVTDAELRQVAGDPDALETQAQVDAAFDQALRNRAAATPKPNAPKTGFRVPARADGVDDVLNAIEQLGGIRSPAAVKKANELAVFDGFREAFGQGVARMLVSRKGSASMPDQLLQELEEMGYRYESTSELYEAVRRAVAEREVVRQAMQRAERTDGFFDALLDNRGRSAAEKTENPKKVDELRVGDAFAVKGQRVDVVDLDPDTGAVIVQHEELGRHRVPSGTVVFADRGSFRRYGVQQEDPVEATPFVREEHRGSGSAFDAAQPRADAGPDWVRTRGESRRGRKLIEGIARGGRKPEFSPRSIVDFVNDAVEVEMRRSRSQTTRRHPAFYWHMGHVTFTRRGMSQINFHEAGHGMKELLEARAPKFFHPIRSELLALTQRQGSMASAKNEHEGVAEWMRLRIVDPAAVEASPITRHIEAGLDRHLPGTAAAVRDAARAWQRFQGLPAVDRWRQLNRDMKETGALKPWNIRAVAQSMADKAMMAVASGSPVSGLDRRIFRSILKNRKEMGLTYKKALEAARKARGRTRKVMRAHNNILSIPSEVQNALMGTGQMKGLRIIQANGNFRVLSGQTWKEVMALVPGRQWDDFQHAGWARESLNRWKQDRMEYPGLRDGLAPADLEQIVENARREIANFDKAFEAVQRYFDTLLDIKLEGGLKKLGEVEKMRRRGEYWPLPRVLWGGGAQPATVRTKADGHIQSGDFRAHGSGEAIRDLMEVAEQRTRDAFTGYYWNRLGVTMADNMRQLANDKTLPQAARQIAGRVLQPLKLQRKVAATMTRAEGQQIVAEALRQKAAEELGEVPEELAEMIRPENINLAWEFKEIWRADAPKDYHVISLLRDGERFFFQVEDPMMFHYFAQSQDAGPIVKAANWALMPSVQNWKRNITQSLPFAVFRNLPGDLANQVALNQGAVSWIPGGATTLGMWNKFSKKYPQAFDQGLLLSRQEPSSVELVNQMRHAAPFRFITEGLYVSRNPNPLVRWMSTAFQPANWLYPFFKTGDIINLVTGGKLLAPLFEGATREGAAVAEKIRGMSDEAAKDAYWRVTGRFNEHPGFGGVETLFRIPGFFNPMAQAIRGITQNLLDPDPAVSGSAAFKLFAYIPAIFGAAATVRYLTMDEEEKERERERPIEQRTNYYDVGGYQLRFPLGIEGAMGSFAYNAVMDHLLEYEQMEGTEEARLYLNRVFSWEGVLPLMGPQMKAATEASMNWSKYFQRHIVSPWMEGLPESEQYSARTPEFYKKLGQWFDYSPTKLQHILSSGVSQQADEVIRVIDNIQKGKPIEERADLPFVGRLFVRDPIGFAAQSVRDVGVVEDKIQLMEMRLRAKGWSQIHDMEMHPPESLTPEMRALQMQVQQARVLRSATQRMQRYSEMAKTFAELEDWTAERNMRRAMVEYAQNALVMSRDQMEKIEQALEMIDEMPKAEPEQFEMDVMRRRMGN